MGFLFSRENRADSIKILVRNLKIDEPTATNIYDSSRPTMTVDGGLSPDTQKRMVAFFSKITPSKDAADADRVFDFSSCAARALDSPDAPLEASLLGI